MTEKGSLPSLIEWPERVRSKVKDAIVDGSTNEALLDCAES
jgi:hypothetical protein